ncbi:OmpA family protein [Colwelliaceae bacterium 6441]
MRFSTVSKICQAISFSVLSLSTLANEQPNAESLVGHKYIGGHAMYIKTDHDRLFTSNEQSSIDSGAGVGGEFGYRVSPFYEARISYTHLNIDADHKAYDIPSGSSIALDLLYFPYKENFYVVAGADFLDIDKSNLSADLGLGYRHYLSQNTAIYLEGKSHYQLDDSFNDFSTKIGFVYYFGTKPAPIKRRQKTVENTHKVVEKVAKDSDNDGVMDPKDQCPKTPMSNKVNDNGCTIFTEQQETINLLVNFENNKSDVASDYLAEIAKVAEFMKQYPQTQLTINGHTSSLGDAVYNQQLSEKRAKAIIDVLVNNFDINKSRLTAVGYGEEQLINEANTAAAHAQNRRIQAKVQTTKKVAKQR